MENELTHHGILGQKWNERNGPPYPLSRSNYSAAERRLNRMDKRYVRKNQSTITRKAKKLSKAEIDAYEKNVMRSKYNMRLRSGKVSKQYINEYNRKLAELMSQKTSNLRSPSGKVVAFVAKRGEVGVYMALATPDYDMSRLKNGVWAGGKIAYKRKNNMVGVMQ